MSRSKTIPPTITKETGSLEGTRKTHPAYGMLRFSRVSGNPGKLFGSEINHTGYIEMTLAPGEEMRGLSNTWYFGHSKCLCSVMMSAAQFAELITSMNIGSGVPVTIEYVADETGQRPGIYDPDTLHETVKREIRKEADDTFKDASTLAEHLTKTVMASKLTKGAKEELISLVNKVTGAVRSSLPFVITQYEEAAEHVGAKAKAELDAYTTSVINRLGTKALAALNENPLPANPTIEG